METASQSLAMGSFIMESLKLTASTSPVNFWWVFANPQCDEITFVCPPNHTDALSTQSNDTLLCTYCCLPAINSFACY